jgi:hypothetical protein
MDTGCAGARRIHSPSRTKGMINNSWVGSHGCLDDLNRRQIQSKHQCDRGTENGRDAENGYVADHHSDRHAERQPIRRNALAQQGQERLENFVAQPVFHGDTLAEAGWSRYSRFQGE